MWWKRISIPIILVVMAGFVSPCRALGISRALHETALHDMASYAEPALDDLVIGDDPVDEILVITDRYEYQGDIRVINQGSLIVQGSEAHLVLTGNLYVQDNGTFRVSGGTFTLNQLTRYQFGYYATGHADIIFNNAAIRCNGMPGNATFANTSTVSFTGTDADTVCTAMAMNQAAVTVDQSSHVLEIIITGAAQVDLSDATGMVVWLGFDAGDIVDFTMPETTGSVDWAFSSDLPGVSGVEYRLTMTNCTGTMLGFLAWSGCDVTVRDSNVRMAGVVLDGSGTETVTGLVNQAHYSDRTFGFTNLALRMIDTTVKTWNLYSFGSQDMVLNDCILGEVNTYGTSTCTMTHCFVDGTGGYLGVWDNSWIIFGFSTAACETMVTGSGILIASWSTQTMNRLTVRQNGIVLLSNSSYIAEPVLADAALVVDAALWEPDWQTPLESDVPVTGTARVLTGPDNTMELEKFWLEYGEGSNPETWIPLGDEQTEPVVNGELAVWDTRGLTAGSYTLRLSVKPVDSDAAAVTRTVDLGEYPTYTPGPTATPSPTPLPTGLTLDLSMPDTELAPMDDFLLTLKITNGDPDPISADIYLALVVGDAAWFWDTWTEDPDFQRRLIPGQSSHEEPVLQFIWPEVAGPGSAMFYAVATEPGGMELLNDPDSLIFSWL